MSPPMQQPLSRYESAVALVQSRRSTPEWAEIDFWERVFARFPQQACPLRNLFTPGMCVRVLTMPSGTTLTSKIHMVEHPFVIVSGVAKVWTLESGWVEYRAPHLGITKPGTRRVLQIVEDCTWLTFHATNATTQEEVEKEIFFDHMQLGHMADVNAEKMAEILNNQKGVCLNELQ